MQIGTTPGSLKSVSFWRYQLSYCCGTADAAMLLHESKDLNRRQPDLDDGGDELQQEAWHFEEAGEEVVEKVHDQALDVGAVMVLVCHDHQVAIAQLLHAAVLLQECIRIQDFADTRSERHCKTTMQLNYPQALPQEH